MALDSGPLLIVQTLKRHVTDRCEPFLAAKNQLRSDGGYWLSGCRSYRVGNGWRRREASQSWLMEICTFSKASPQTESI
jgi:hypothetical protein